MINNANYLNQSNNFKILTITDKKLHQMAESKHSFFKYIKAQKLKFRVDNDTQESIESFIAQLHNTCDKAKIVVNVDNL